MTMTESECDRLNEGRVQGKPPYPIVRHCYHCAPVNPTPDESGVVHIEDNVSDTDEVYLSDDHEVGLTFTCHSRCGELEPIMHELFCYRVDGGQLH
jgi:hypothetical protein